MVQTRARNTTASAKFVIRKRLIIMRPIAPVPRRIAVKLDRLNIARYIFVMKMSLRKNKWAHCARVPRTASSVCRPRPKYPGRAFRK